MVMGQKFTYAIPFASLVSNIKGLSIVRMSTMEETKLINYKENAAHCYCII